MISETKDGFEIDFEDEELDNPVAKGMARAFVKLSAAVWDTVSVEPISRRRAEEAKLSIELIKLSGRYLNECLACMESKAWFAASIMGMAMLETVLILACIADKARMQTSKAWTSYHANKKLSFRDRLQHAKLSVLIGVAKEMKWFPEGEARLHYLRNYEGWDEMVLEYPEFTDETGISIEKCADIRNLLHPGKCLREQKAIDLRTSEVGLGLFFLNMIAFMHALGREVADPGMRIKINFSDQIRRIVAAKRGLDPFLAEPDPTKAILQDGAAIRHTIELIRPTLYDLQNPE